MKIIRNFKNLTVILTLIFVVSTLFAACGGTQENTPNQNANNNSSGSVTAVGSSALQPLAEKVAQQFMAKNKDIKVLVQGGGSGTGLKQVSEGGANIGNSDVFAEEKLPAEKARELVDHKVAVVGFAAVVNPRIKVDNLTKQQLIDIFTGKITNWKDVGGDDIPVVLLSRPKSSGTRATFEKYALDGNKEAEGMALSQDSSGAIKKTLADTEGAISYLALSYITKDVKALKYEGVEPNVENVKNGTYPIWSYEHMYTKGEPTGAVKAFLDYMVSDEVKSTISQMGYIPVSDMKVSR